jgi:Fe-S cluster assembly protein SufB
VGAQYDSGTVYHKIREDLSSEKGSSSLTPTRPCVSTRSSSSVLRHDHPAQRQQVRRAEQSAVWSGGSFVYVPPGVRRRHPAAGLLPHQHREHGPVRADPDHRRRGRLRALRRGLHGPDLLTDSLHAAVVEIIALKDAKMPLHDRSRTGRTTSTTWSPSAPVAEARRTMEWIDGNIGLQGDDEVPVGLPDGPRSPRRHPVGRVRSPTRRDGRTLIPTTRSTRRTRRSRTRRWSARSARSRSSTS